jgi:hypothetical protein
MQLHQLACPIIRRTYLLSARQSLHLSLQFRGSVTGYSVSPALPAGLSLNTTSGVISGTPTTVTSTATYTVTAANSGGNTSFGVAITVNAIAPGGLSYNSPNVFTVGSAIAALNPTISGSSYRIQHYSGASCWIVFGYIKWRHFGNADCRDINRDLHRYRCKLGRQHIPSGL